jgi:hypothetical protein
VADILADYREWRDAQPVRVSTHGGRCHMWHRDCMIHRLADALERARLTNAEREAIETSFDALQFAADELGLGQGDCDRLAATLRGLLERTR